MISTANYTIPLQLEAERRRSNGIAEELKKTREQNAAMVSQDCDVIPKHDAAGTHAASYKTCSVATDATFA